MCRDLGPVGQQKFPLRLKRMADKKAKASFFWSTVPEEERRPRIERVVGHELCLEGKCSCSTCSESRHQEPTSAPKTP